MRRCGKNDVALKAANNEEDDAASMKLAEKMAAEDAPPRHKRAKRTRALAEPEPQCQ